MIVIEPGRCRIAHTSKVTVSEIEQLLRLRDASVLHVVPRSIGDVHKYLSSENKLDNSGDSTVSTTEDNVRDLELKPSKGATIPPELWEPIVQNTEVGTTVTKRDIGSFVLVCRWWAVRWRRHFFETAKLKNEKDVHTLVELLRFETPYIPSMRTYIKKLFISHTQPKAKPDKWLPWLHTVYMLLHKPLLRKSPALTICMELRDIPYGFDPTSKVKRTVHHIFPQPTPTLHPRCHDLELTSLRFISILDVSRLLQKLPVSRSLKLTDVLWESTRPYRPTPVTIRSLSLSDGTQYVDAFGLIACRKIGNTIYEMADVDMVAVNEILRAAEGSPRKQRISYLVEESNGASGHACVHFRTRCDANVDAMLFSCACFPSDAILPGQEAGGTRRRYHLKVRNIIFLVNQLTLRGLYGKSTNWSLVGAAVQRLSRLRNFTIGFKYQSTMEEFTLKETDAFEPLVQSERLSFAYLADISANPTTKWLADENDTWILVDAKSLQATGRTLKYVMDRAGGFGSGPPAQWPLGGLNALLPQCSDCGSSELQSSQQ